MVSAGAPRSRRGLSLLGLGGEPHTPLVPYSRFSAIVTSGATLIAVCQKSLQQIAPNINILILVS